LAWSALESNDVKAAKAYWRKTLAIQPRNKAAKFHLKQMQSR